MSYESARGPSATEGLTTIGGQTYYAVPGIDAMSPFLMNVVSDGDRWMFVSSTGGLTAGRRDASGALFRYDPEDRIHAAAGVVGPVTAVRVGRNAEELWTPFRGRPEKEGSRALFKSVVGDSLIFEEVNPDLNLRFRYRWASSDRFGFIRTATLLNDHERTLRVDLVDGLVGLLPHGIDPGHYRAMSNLVNAYMRSEIIDESTRLAVFTLEAGAVDRPEPQEVLRGTVAWSIAPDGFSSTLDSNALLYLERGAEIRQERLVTGRPGAYLLTGAIEVDPGEEISWHIVADTGQDHSAVVALRNLLQTRADLEDAVESSISDATASLARLMAPADASQVTGDPVAAAHHVANVTYNVMRGGVPVSGYRIKATDFARFVSLRNRQIAETHRDWIDSIPEEITRHDLNEQIQKRADPQLTRLGLEYLPFGFSRRHGDPSRPWNAFSIRVRDDSGQPVLYFEGNWRDIFQNWEALANSFPRFLTSMISVFVNASTPDGFNPYRITSLGIDWEVPDPDDPWSNIGYWGDHQIVYLYRLLAAADRYLPGEVESLFGQRLFSYADVPFRIAPYEELVKDPKATVAYDFEAAQQVAARVDRMGSDGKLVPGQGGEPLLVTLAEKLFVSALAKLSSLVPGGGIWMNTQRPEWNDANNALVGFGVSMVTLCQLRRYLEHLRTLVRASGTEHVAISTEVATWMSAITSVLGDFEPAATAVSDSERKRVMDGLGRAFTDYRSSIYANGFSGVVEVSLESVADLCDVALEHLDATIARSRRPSNLYHSYNLIEFADDGEAVSVEHLHEMLEGQVAILESGVLSAEEKADVVEALFSSDMYDPDRQSFMLYPARRPPSFLDKNVVPESSIAENPLLAALIDAGNRSVVVSDSNGSFRFNAGFANSKDVEAALDILAGDPSWSSLVAEHREAALEVYEEVFRHHAYTGRSGSMYGYEGIGSIYWHMVAKLLLAVQESAVEAASSGAPPTAVKRLVDSYWRIRSGLGFSKTAGEFGAIPIDPYSHTPAHAGAQQPGMTGLVKEELLTRPLELGVRVEDGKIGFDPLILRRTELLSQREAWSPYDISLEPLAIELDEGSLGVTVCQVPVVVSTTHHEPRIEVFRADGSEQRIDGVAIDRETSAEIFSRSGAVVRVNAFLQEDSVD